MSVARVDGSANTRTTVGAGATGIAAVAVGVKVHSRAARRELLADVCLEVGSGRFLAIVGASGSGKSTLLRALAGVCRLSAGRVLLAGHSVDELIAKFPLAVGYLPQFGAFHSELSVREILKDATALRLPGSVAPDARRQWVNHIVAFSGIERLLNQRYHTLSGGQMRRMALAEELIGDPAFLFLDELTSGLDAYSDQEMMLWLRDMAHQMGKTVVLVTHATYHLHLCDAIAFLHEGRLAYYGSYESLLESNGVESVTQLFELYQRGEGSVESGEEAGLMKQEHSQVQSRNEGQGEGEVENKGGTEPQPLRTAKPPAGLAQFPTLFVRQAKLFWRDRGQFWLHLALIVIFPFLVAVFATSGLPQVRNLALALEKNILLTLQEQLLYLRESFHAAALISGMAMFQVILLTLMGANNGAREVAREKDVLQKELRAGLSPAAYISVKFLQMLGLAAIQAVWMASFVKIVCGFPGELLQQFTILFATTLAMSVTCLAISAAAPSAERASLLAIYLVGFQLPLSGAALALPEWLGIICRPFIAAYWGWSGYLQTFAATRHYDIVKQSTRTDIAPYGLCLGVLASHVVVGLALAWYFTRRRQQV